MNSLNSATSLPFLPLSFCHLPRLKWEGSKFYLLACPQLQVSLACFSSFLTHFPPPAFSSFFERALCFLPQERNRKEPLLSLLPCFFILLLFLLPITNAEISYLLYSVIVIPGNSSEDFKCSISKNLCDSLFSLEGKMKFVDGIFTMNSGFAA